MALGRSQSHHGPTRPILNQRLMQSRDPSQCDVGLPNKKRATNMGLPDKKQRQKGSQNKNPRQVRGYQVETHTLETLSLFNRWDPSLISEVMGHLILLTDFKVSAKKRVKLAALMIEASKLLRTALMVMVGICKQLS